MEHDEDRFFSGASRGDYLDALTAHAGLGSVVALEGDSGSGVSTLLGHAVMALLGDMEIVRIDGAAEHSANVVVDSLLRHFDIERAELPDKLREALTDGRLLVVVDNSEELLDEAVATMAALKKKLGARLGYLFGGLPGTVEKLKGADFTLDDVLDLPALHADDVQDFAWFVLGLELDASRSESLAHESDGNIARLLALLRSDDGAPPLALSAAGARSDSEPDEAPTFGARQEAPDEQEEATTGALFSSQVSAQEADPDEGFDDPGEDDVDPPEETQERAAAVTPWRHVAAVAGLLVVVGLLWLVFSGGDDAESGQSAESRELALPVPERPVEADDAGPQEVPRVQPMTSTMEPVARLEDLPPRSAPEEERREDTDVALTPVTDPVMQAPPARQEQEVSVAAVEQGASEAAEDQAEPAPSPDQSEAEPETVPSSEPALTGLDAELGYQQADWLATLADDRWFLQITVTSQEASARGVLDQLDRQGAYYPAERGGKNVYLVLSGDYSSRQAALDAKSTLPAKLRSAGPFPRKMADIRSEL